MSVPKDHPSDRSSAPVLVIAPHLSYPTRDGADIAIDRRWGELSRFVDRVDIVAAHSVIHYENGQIFRETAFENKTRSKVHAALRTLLFKSVYTKEKFLTKSFIEISRPFLTNTCYQAIIYSYLASVPLSAFVGQREVKQYVLTHNDDIAIYRNMRQSSKNVVQKLVALMSERWVRKFGKASKDGFCFIHVSEEDATGWHTAIGDHDYCLGRVGCNLPEIVDFDRTPLHNRAVRLIFVGSLGVKMNMDAIKHFAEEYLPAIREQLEEVDVKIVGSNPTPDVQRLCRHYGFELFANVSDTELAQHFAWADFSLLPFPYSTGTKLKLLDSIARGTPILATSSIGHFEGIGSATACLVSDAPSEWAQHVLKWRTEGISKTVREKLIQVARGWTWEAVAKDFFENELKGYSLPLRNKGAT
jgi:glycosyltransferase involved in cell wall biosynthesis